MKHYMTAIALLVTAMSTTVLSAQEKPDRSIYDFGFVKASNPWLTSSNMSGLHTLQAERTSIVEAG
ncbi:secreted protein, partial [gut metagenome]